MRKFILLLLISFLFISCKSINTTRDKLNVEYSYVLFSFDDGPDGQITPLLLDVLKKYEVKASFCLLGVNAEQYPELVRRIYEEEHVIINHGYYDKHAYKMTKNEFTDNLIRGEKAISSALGFEMNPKLYRPHGGYYRLQQEKIIQEYNYTIVPANIRVYDAVKTSANKEKMENQIINKVLKNGGGIVLLHDMRGSYSSKEIKLEKNPKGPFNRLWIVDSAETVIIDLLERGYILRYPDLLAVINK